MHSSCAWSGSHRTSCVVHYSCARGRLCLQSMPHLSLSVSRLRQLCSEYIAPVPAVKAPPAPVDEYIAPAPTVDAALVTVVEYMASAPAVCAAPTPVVEYVAPMPTVCAEPAPVRKYTASAPAGSYVAPAPMVDVLGPQFHEDIAETSCKSHFHRWPCEEVSAAVTKWARGFRV